MTVDIRIWNHGTIFLIEPQTDAGILWCGEHLPEDAQTWGESIVCEPRYVDEIVNGARADGLEVA